MIVLAAAGHNLRLHVRTQDHAKHNGNSNSLGIDLAQDHQDVRKTCRLRYLGEASSAPALR